MRTYTVHENRSLTAEEDQIRFVKEGIAWWALAMPLLWFLYHRLWWEAAICFGLSFILGLGVEQAGFPETLTLVLSTGVQCLIAFEANDLRALALRRKGYRTIAIVHGVDEEEAELRFYTERTSQRGTDREPVSSSVFDRSGEPIRAGRDASSHQAGVWPKQTSPAAPNPPVASHEVLGLFPTPPAKLS